jgi:purine-binding chemotaxis protein CheW
MSQPTPPDNPTPRHNPPPPSNPVPPVKPTPSPTATTKSFNWDEAKTRLARAASALAEIDNLSDESARTILDQRARKLARTPPQEPDAGELLQLVTFRLGAERFAIEAKFVREMIQLEHITPIPDAPEFLVGTTNLRGEVLAVFDVRGFFGASRAGTDAAASSAALVLGEKRIEFALVADLVEEVATFRTTDFFDSTGAVSAEGREWVRGISPSALVLLDAAALLADPRLVVDEA